MSFIALVDCNNFFVSCERVFNPKLNKKPVVVLSRNDGCIISRSQEAKALGIPMGGAFFEWKEVIERHNVFVFSSNFSLVSDMSRRVMETLKAFNPAIEIYSIDEAFLLLEGIKDPVAHGRMLKEKVLEWTGIPVSIGISQTKTLAKVASDKAKKDPAHQGVCALLTLDDCKEVLYDLPTEDVWGIGRNMALTLAKRGVHTALELTSKQDMWIRKYLSVFGLKTVLELRGERCFTFGEETPPKQTILTSRSFRYPIESKEKLREKIGEFAAKGAEKLREEGSYALGVSVFIMNPFYGNEAHTIFREPTDYTPFLIEGAIEAFERIYKTGFAYKRAGVQLFDLTSSPYKQLDFFQSQDNSIEEKRKRASLILDEINAKWGYSILRYAAQGLSHMQDAHLLSSDFTTSWDEILTINI